MERFERKFECVPIVVHWARFAVSNLAGFAAGGASPAPTEARETAAIGVAVTRQGAESTEGTEKSMG
jgi:hypothetical protein